MTKWTDMIKKGFDDTERLNKLQLELRKLGCGEDFDLRKAIDADITAPEPNASTQCTPAEPRR